MSNASEWYDDKWAEVEIWKKDPVFVKWMEGKYLPVNEVDRLFEIVRLHNQFERMASEIKNQQ